MIGPRGLLGAALAIALVVVAPTPGPAVAAEITVLSAGAMRGVVSGLAEQFQRESGHAVRLAFDTMGGLRRRAPTEPADVLIMTDAGIDDMARSGIVVAGTRTDLARVGIGVAVKDGAPAPDISTPEALKQALLHARTLVYLDPATGATSAVHVARVLDMLGIADAVRDKTVLWPGGFAAEAVAQGRAELCIHQISEILPVPGVKLVGPLPGPLQKVTTYSGGLVARSNSPEAARAWLAFLARPEFRARFAAAGLDYRQ